jgi:hypothetical protein
MEAGVREAAINRFVSRLPRLQSFEVVGCVDEPPLNLSKLFKDLDLSNQSLLKINARRFSFEGISLEETDQFVQVIAQLRNLERLLFGCDPIPPTVMSQLLQILTQTSIA